MKSSDASKLPVVDLRSGTSPPPVWMQRDALSIVEGSEVGNFRKGSLIRLFMFIIKSNVRVRFRCICRNVSGADRHCIRVPVGIGVCGAMPGHQRDLLADGSRVIRWCGLRDVGLGGWGGGGGLAGLVHSAACAACCVRRRRGRCLFLRRRSLVCNVCGHM